MLQRLWIIFAVSTSFAVTTYIIETTISTDHFLELNKGFLSRIHDGLYFGLMGGIYSFVVLCYFVYFVYFSSGSVALKTLNLMMHERRLLFIIILLGILFYIDNICILLGCEPCAFSLYDLFALSLDLIVTYFPRRVSLTVMALIVLMLFWNIYKHSFNQKDCEQISYAGAYLAKRLAIAQS